MNCPVCDEKMREVEKHGVMLDICPGCKGVWLDRGELDKIIALTQEEGGASEPPSAPLAPPRPTDAGYREDRPRYRDDDDDDDRHGQPWSRGHDHERHGGTRRRRGGILGELFDMIGD